MREATYRPYRQGAVAAPLHARSVGHYVARPGWRDAVMRKDFLQLFWGVDGRGAFAAPDGAHELGPGEVCFYFPGDLHRIERLTPRWEYYWLTVDGPGVPDAIRHFALARGPRFAGPCPTDFFERLAEELRDYRPAGEYRAAATAYAVLSAALGGGGAEEDGGGLAARFAHLVERVHADPSVNVAELARRLGAHRATLARLARRRFGMSATEYLLSRRLQRAMSLLCGTDIPVKEAARRSGFSDANYFAKVVARRLGQSPTELRRRR